ncbi:helix-turn-helix domain-containing protein [Lactobacillus helveticus]|uniref:helix-turn-helix domain-containing protein n=1 Tax=Lactobacillus helveticus TaxID=1587 RepID=UPI0015626DF5|nr:helix-turn-helix transcriptional regulator [Lactobacillus helveticus]NRN88409.1 HTH-type transcriptional regulator ImmR [Lactobacillus helveticus]
MNRIKQLRNERNLTLVELGEQLNLPKGTLSRYEHGTREPKEPMWQALANFFNVTVPYLQGIDDKTVIKKFSSEDLLQELLDRKVLEPVKDKPINLDDVFLLHK